MRRTWVWLQLIIGWLPMWALFTTLIVTMHPGSPPLWASLISLRMIVAAAGLGLIVRRLTQRFQWPRRVRLSFIALHLVAALVFGVAWLLLSSIIESLIGGALVIPVGPGFVPFLVVGAWLYIMVAGVAYATQATERAARAEANAARSQLEALRSQLNPHFLFNALHTVVQLIPREPRRAAQAAEQLGGLLRKTIEEDRDLVPLAEERAFVARYLEVEGLRFGDRLTVRIEVTPEADRALVPSFALQTLVENAVRHGAEPSVEPTEVAVDGRIVGDALVLTVRDTGAGASAAQLARSNGTGLARLRDRLAVLFGGGARLDLTTETPRGFTVSLRVPLSPAD